MKAITYSEFGAAADVLTLENIEEPPVNTGEVVVKLAYSAVNPSDVKARAGGRPGVTAPPFPTIIPNSDGAGVIVDVGQGVDKSRIGQRVWIWNGQWKRAFGTSAEYITLPQNQAVLLPDSTDVKHGAILGIPALTAVHAVTGQGSVDNKTLFVSGGNGTVGRLAIQIAKARGATVITSVSDNSALALPDASAPDLVLDYRSEDLVEQTLDFTGGKTIDRFIEVEFGKNINNISRLIAENGAIATFGSSKDMTPTLPFYPLMFKAVTIEMILVYLLNQEARIKAINTLTSLLESDALDFQIDSILALEDAVKAHELVQSGQRSGSVLLKNCKYPA